VLWRRHGRMRRDLIPQQAWRAIWSSHKSEANLWPFYSLKPRNF